MEKGYLSILLHAHLPYVRHPEHEDFLEEEFKDFSKFIHTKIL